MKFIICPFCKSRINASQFPASRRGRQHIVMLCPSCKRKLAFTIREQDLPNDKATDVKDTITNSDKILAPYEISVVENRFTYNATFPLFVGSNWIGRYNDKYTSLEIPIHTSDPSMDRTHCAITVEALPDEEYIVTIADNNSLTGTFVNTKEVEQGEQRLLHNGDVITLGATTLLFQKCKL